MIIKMLIWAMTEDISQHVTFLSERPVNKCNNNLFPYIMCNYMNDTISTIIVTKNRGNRECGNDLPEDVEEQPEQILPNLRQSILLPSIY